MASVTYVTHDGTRHDVTVADGDTVMQGAMNAMIEGITAECGGGLACGTCHVYVADEWFDRVGAPSEAERDMLAFAATDPGPTSRLSCQIAVTDALDGLVVRLPASQY